MPNQKTVTEQANTRLINMILFVMKLQEKKKPKILDYVIMFMNDWKCA